MPVPFRDLRGEDALGLAGFLRFVDEETGRGIRGALFLINARGEPVEFVFSRSSVHASVLWRDGEARRSALASLADVLFTACPQTPAFIMALAADVHPKLFTEDVLVDLPVCLVAADARPMGSPGASTEVLTDGISLAWTGERPAAGSPARRLLDSLIARQLIIEPFERAAIGIGEAFRDE